VSSSNVRGARNIGHYCVEPQAIERFATEVRAQATVVVQYFARMVPGHTGAFGLTAYVARELDWIVAGCPAVQMVAAKVAIALQHDTQLRADQDRASPGSFTDIVQPLAEAIEHAVW